jgi:GT2 family glycosyltransferase
MVERLVFQLIKFKSVFKVIITLNIPESLSFPSDSKIYIITNKHPLGFSENHNNAFELCDQLYFCVVNPDIELYGNPFDSLIGLLYKENVALVAPRVDGRNGEQENSWRKFPTLISVLLKFLRRDDGIYSAHGKPPNIMPDWVGGMFMLFKSSTFQDVGRFDASYFLYYEDVDICYRLVQKGYSIMVCPTVHVVHEARRESHRRIKFLYWHLSSMFRYFYKRVKLRG